MDVINLNEAPTACFDDLSTRSATAIAATLRSQEREWEVGEALLPLWHWCYFWPTVASDTLGIDGHLALRSFTATTELPRRMWAGSQLEFYSPLLLGRATRKTSRVLSITPKQGKSGAMVFVKMEHCYHGGAAFEQLLLRDVQDLVYREAARPGEVQHPALAPDHAAWEISHHPDPVLLFRYSALTFNSHRIHYDFPYVTQVEGYRDLVVHGPLIATLLMEAAVEKHPHLLLRRYEFKAVSPAFCNQPLILCVNSIQENGMLLLWAKNANGHILMQATASFDS